MIANDTELGSLIFPFSLSDLPKSTFRMPYWWLDQSNSNSNPPRPIKSACPTVSVFLSLNFPLLSFTLGDFSQSELVKSNFSVWPPAPNSTARISAPGKTRFSKNESTTISVSFADRNLTGNKSRLFKNSVSGHSLSICPASLSRSKVTLALTCSLPKTELANGTASEAPWTRQNKTLSSVGDPLSSRPRSLPTSETSTWLNFSAFFVLRRRSNCICRRRSVLKTIGCGDACVLTVTESTLTATSSPTTFSPSSNRSVSPAANCNLESGLNLNAATNSSAAISTASPSLSEAIQVDPSNDFIVALTASLDFSCSDVFDGSNPGLALRIPSDLICKSPFLFWKKIPGLAFSPCLRIKADASSAPFSSWITTSFVFLSQWISNFSDLVSCSSSGSTTSKSSSCRKTIEPSHDSNRGTYPRLRAP